MNKRKRDEADAENEDESSAKRQRIAPFGAWLAGIERRVRHVQYQGEPIKAAGSKFVQAHLGPDSFMPRANDAKAKLPFGIRAARTKYPKCYFKAGHMLNCNLGGNGKNPKNLTILRAAANTSMTKHDNAIARACGHLRSLYQALHTARADAAQLSCCISVHVKVSKVKWGLEAPDSHITTRVTIIASVLHEPDLDELITDSRLLADAKGALRRVQAEANKGCGVVINRKPA
jgi:hypothetical protein